MAKVNFKVLENEWIPLSDGRKLAARIWMPKDAKKNPVPAILEYIPYRKRDGTAPRDEFTYPAFAEAGYAGVRVDISGWCDGYINAPPAVAENLGTTTKAINGPWIHKYPHLAWPKPRMDFLGEAINWWDRWLKDIENQVEDLPAYRAYISEDVHPLLRREHDSGHWVSESELPSQNTRHRQYYLAPNRQLLYIPGAAFEKTLRTPLNFGTACGEFFSNNPESDLPGDQRLDDAGSLVFDSAKLHKAIEILGRPHLHLKITVDKPFGNIIVRLNDIHPDGVVNRVSWGVLNLAHRHSNENPEPMTPGKTEIVDIQLDECGYRFLPGHKMRVALSTSYWPMVMPPPEIVTVKVTLGANAVITLPVRFGDDSFRVDEPENPDSLPRYKYHSPAESRRWVEQDLKNGEAHYHVFDDTGESEIPGHGLCTRHTHKECWSIATDDPLSYRATSLYISWMRRGDWSIRTESQSSFSCDAENFYIEATVTAFESDQQVNQRQWKKCIKRDFI